MRLRQNASIGELFEAFIICKARQCLCLASLPSPAFGPCRARCPLHRATVRAARPMGREFPRSPLCFASSVPLSRKRAREDNPLAPHCFSLSRLRERVAEGRERGLDRQ